VLAFAADYAAAFFGAKKAGASTYALVGAAIGTVVGVFAGPLGLLFLPLVGATIGQYITSRDALKSGTVGLATWIGLLVGTVLKIVFVCLMLGVFAMAYFWR
jgi:uncharacterized protein